MITRTLRHTAYCERADEAAYGDGNITGVATQIIGTPYATQIIGTPYGGVRV